MQRRKERSDGRETRERILAADDWKSGAVFETFRAQVFNGEGK